jgi:chlorobactene glucosyltransferase
MTPMELLPALPWLAPFAGLVRLARAQPNLSDIAPSQGEPVSIIIPARNEAANIEAAVRSILASGYQPFELLVVDDQSTDATAAIVERLAGEDARVRLVRGSALPQGWYGKPWACVQGYRAAGAGILLFTDADTRHGPELLGRAVGAMRKLPADLVTVAPHQRCESFWERLIMPQIWLLLALRYHPRKVNRARGERDVIANGQFILVTREAYEAVGTHAVVRHEVVEDLVLAQAFLRGGRRMHFAFAERLMETRMYRSLGEIIEGWSKNIYLGARRSYPKEPLRRALAPAMLAAGLGFWLVPLAVLALTGGRGSLAGAALLASGLSALFWSMMSLAMRIPMVYGLGYPLGAAMALLIAARSVWRGERKVTWRGRTYGA